MNRLLTPSASRWVALLATLLMTAPSSASRTKRVAVMAFESASSDPQFASLGKGLQAMITTDLNHVGAYELVERSRLADIQGELKLAKTGAIDTKTAAKIGKLAGASHLLAGTVTVLGAKMRIDARMFETQTGKILLTESIAGAKDEFFDLPKQLVKKMVGVTGVKMSPKVRVKVNRVHTADFQVFNTFSDGIAAYDAKEFKKSVRLLKKAAQLDPDFKLARMTLADYEDRIAKMKDIATSTATNKRKSDAIKRNARASKEAARLDALWKQARQTDKSKRVERLYALHELAYIFNDAYNRVPNLNRLEDRFDMARIADALVAQYIAEARKMYPRVPLLPLNRASFNWGREPRGARDQKRLDRLAVVSRHQWKDICRRLVYSAEDCARMIFATVKRLTKVGADREDLASDLIAAGKLFRHALAIDASTAAYTDAQKLTKDPYRAKTLVKEVEANRNVKRFLKQCKPGLGKELFITGGWSSSWRARACDDASWNVFTGGNPLAKAYRLRSARSVPRYNATLVGDTPVWVFGHRDVVTGARTDLYRTDALVYFEPKAGEDGVLTMIGSEKTKAPSFSLRTSFEPVKGWFPLRGKGRYRPASGRTNTDHEAGRPRIVVGVGLVDVDVAMHDDPTTGKRVVRRPMRGYGVMLDANGMHLVAMTEKLSARRIVRTNRHEDLNLAWKRLDLKILKTKANPAHSKNSVTWKIGAAGGVIKAKIGGVSTGFKLPKPLENGYVGVWIEGQGYAHFGTIKGR